MGFEARESKLKLVCCLYHQPVVPMEKRKVRLIWGAVIWAAGYGVLNMGYHTLSENLNKTSEEELAVLAQGQKLSENCANCHYIDQRANFVGPHLVDLIGRRSGEVDGFDYSPALKRLHVTWTHENLIAFLQAPQQFAPGTKMAVSGWSEAEAAAIAKYLESRP